MADDIRVKFTADGSSYNKQLKELTQQNRTLKSEVDKVKSSTDQNTTAQEKAAKVAEAVQKQVKGQEEYIKALKSEYDKLSQAEGDNSTELMKQEEKINKAEIALNKMNDELEAAQREADGYGNETEEATRQTQEMDEAARLLAASKLAEFYSRVSEEIQKVAGAAYDAAKELDEGYDTIVKKTGATGDDLSGMSAMADEIFGSMPVAMADVGSAIGEVNTRLNLTGDELKDASVLFLKFARINDTNVSTSVDAVQKALSAFGLTAKDTPRILDTMTAAGQSSGVGMNELASAMVKNAGALSQLGLNAEQSIMFIGKLEKSGVDSETALSGMSRALKNAVKEGKPLNVALEELENTIVNGTNDMDGLTVAYDLFGKSGDKIYNAVKTGSLSFRDLAGSVEDYSGTVENTYEGTLSAWDKSTVAMNNLKIAGKELAGEALEAIAPLLEKVVDLVQKGVKWFKNLPEPVKKTVAVIGLLAAGAGVAFPKVQSLFQTISMFKAANAIKGLTGVSDATGKIAGNAGKASGAMALLTNPVTLGVAAVSALGLALVGLAKHTENMIEAEYGLTDAQKEQIEAAAESRQKVEEMAAARQEAVDGVQAEFDYIENLAREYDTLIDANGKVKKGYEDRANFILGELATATGQTIEQIRDEIDENGKLKQSIYEVIDMKRAEATLSAYESSYADAKQQQAKAQSDYAAAVATASEREKEYNRVMDGRAGEYVRQSEALRQQMSGLDQTSAKYQELSMQLSVLDEAYTQERAELATVTEAWDQSKQAVTDAGIAMAEYNTTIKNYEGLSSAIISGDQKKIQEALTNLVNNMQTAETGTRESLEAQLEAAKTNLSNMKKAFSEGRVDEAAVEMCRDVVDAATRELEKLKDVGEDVADGLADGMGVDSNRKVKARGERLGQEAVKSVAKGAETASPSKATKRTGQDVGQGLIAGMKEKEGSVKTGGTNLGKAATGGVTAGADKESAKRAGGDVANSLKLGMDEKKAIVGSSAKGVADRANTNIKPGTSGVYSAGQNLGAQLESGITSKKGAVGNAATAIKNETDKAKPNKSDFEAAGRNVVQGLINGLNDHVKQKELARVTQQMASTVNKVTQRTYQYSSPSKVFRKIGNYVVEGLALGLQDTAPVQKAAQEMADAAMLPTLSFGAEGVNGKAVSKSLTYGDIVVNVSGANVQNEELLAKRISNEIFRQVQTERMAFL